MILNGEQLSFWKEVVMAYLKGTVVVFDCKN
jgi:hypothetical protein